MNSRIFSLFSAVAIALAATAPLSRAVTYTPSQVNAALKAAIGSKIGAPAYNAAANLFKKALGDKSDKKSAKKYAQSVIKALNKKVKTALIGKSRSTLVKALCDGYFKGVTYSPMDSKFVAALKILSSKLPISQQTQATAALIASPALAFNTKKGGSASDVNFLNQTIYTSANTTPPPPVS